MRELLAHLSIIVTSSIFLIEFTFFVHVFFMCAHMCKAQSAMDVSVGPLLHQVDPGN